MAGSIFDGMTNLYSLSKTLRFELKPVGKTPENIEKNDVIGKDSKKSIAYKDIKPLLDRLHEQFINGSLSNKTIDINLYFDQRKQIYQTQDKIEKRKLLNDKNGIQKTEKQLRLEIKGFFEIQGDRRKQDYELKKGGMDVLSNDGMFKILKKNYQDKPEMGIIKEFDKFTTYFSGYNQNRANYYVADDKDTAITNRIVHENLPKFCANINAYEKFLQSTNIVNDISYFTKEYFSKCMDQKGIEQYNTAIGQINQAINLHNQKTGEKTKQLHILYKQIGCGVKKEFIVNISDKNHLVEILNNFLAISNQKNNDIDKLFKVISGFNTEAIYLSKKGLTQLSSALFGSWFALSQKLVEMKIGTFDKKTQENKIPDFVSLSDIIECIEINPEFIKDEWKEKGYTTFLSVLGGYIKYLKDSYEVNSKALSSIMASLDEKNDQHKDIIKSFADSCLVLVQTLKRFVVKESKVGELESGFYNPLNEILSEYHVAKWYDMLRNYLTKKPYSEEKIKLNFEKGNLLGGRPDSPEGNTQYCGFIFRKEEKYFLGITNDTKLFDKKKYPGAYIPNGSYEKMIYKQIDGKTIYGSSYKGKFGSLYASDKNILSNDVLISRIKMILEEKKIFFPELQYLIGKDYKEPNHLAVDIGELTLYTIEFTEINEEYLLESVEKGGSKCLYLFEIYNKDFGKRDKSSSNNLHTEYFLQLFNGKSEDGIVKLSGGAEVFYRPKTLNLPTREDKQGKKVVAHKRYNDNKFLFHLPISLNGDKSNKIKGFNDIVNNIVLEHIRDICVIGIDRGEKHLAYYSVVTSAGKIIEQGSLNKDLLGKDYAEKLASKAKNRDDARKNRTTIGTIKELKEGYISQVVRRIADLALKHNALVVLEDLNVGFKRGRQKIEKSVYQKLELALAKKLNYLVNKNVNEGPGSVMQAYQLTAPVQNFSDIHKQCGIILYTRANYTSTTDPVTGRRRHLYLKTGPKDFMIKELQKLDFIRWNPTKSRYECGYTYKGKQRILESDIERFRTFSKDRKYRETESNIMTERLDIKRSGIIKNDDILRQFFNADRNEILENVINELALWMQIRNTHSQTGEDCIISPVSDKSHNKFDSRKELLKADNDEYDVSKTKNALLPLSGDANGAYNIARKGLMMIQRIKENTEKPNLYISDEDWDNEIQKNI